MIVPGLVHDHCSAVHPIAAASPFLAELDLAARRAHVAATGGRLRPSARRRFGRRAVPIDRSDRRRRSAPTVSGGVACSDQPTTHFDDLFADASQPVLRVPRHPLTLARFGAGALLPATALGRMWRTEQAKALWAGIAAHAFSRLDRPMTSAVGLMLIAACHAKGWVVAQGRLAGDRRRVGRRHRTPRRHDRDRRARDVGRPTCRRATW